MPPWRSLLLTAIRTSSALPAMPRDKSETDQLAQLVLWLANLNVHTFLGNLP